MAAGKEPVMTAAEIDRLAQRYRMGHKPNETLGEFIVRMAEGER